MSQPQNNENVITVRRLMRALSSLWDKFTAALSTKADSQTVTADLALKANQSDFHDLQADVNALVRIGKQRLETVETYLFAKQVFTLIVDDTLLVAAPHGYLDANDKVVFGRYTRTAFRQKKEDGGRATVFRKKGWTVPQLFNPQLGAPFCRPLVVMQLCQWDYYTTDRLKYKCADGTTSAMVPYLQEYTFFEVHTEDWDGEMSTAEDLYDYNGGMLKLPKDTMCVNKSWHPINLIDNKLGIRIYRGGDDYSEQWPLTDWLPFRITFDDYNGVLRLCKA